MDLRKIKKLMELLEESGIAEIEVKEGEESIKLSRNTSISSTPVQQVIQQPQPQIQAIAQQPVNSDTQTSTPLENRNTVNSPMVGTFYASASPESKPFVTIGQTIIPSFSI